MASIEHDYKDSTSNLPKCCCCQVWKDSFDNRSVINMWGTTPTKRYSFGHVNLNPGDFGYPGLIDFSSYTPNGWAISGGQLSCSVAGDGISISSVGAADGRSCCFDLTFTGSGKVYYGFTTVFEFDTNRIRFRTDGNPFNKDGYWLPFTWTSGQTYRIRVNQRNYGGFELWIDDVQVLNLALQVSTGMGNWFFTGSGTLAIDNLDTYILGQYDAVFFATVGYPACWPLDPHPFPWLDRGTGQPYEQIQVSYGSFSTFCHNLGFGNLGSATVIMDYVPELSNVTFPVYEATGTFGDFTMLRVTLTYPEISMAFSGAVGGWNSITDSYQGYGTVVGVPGVLITDHGDTDTWTWSQGRSQCGITSCTVSVP